MSFQSQHASSSLMHLKCLPSYSVHTVQKERYPRRKDKRLDTQTCLGRYDTVKTWRLHEGVDDNALIHCVLYIMRDLTTRVYYKVYPLANSMYPPLFPRIPGVLTVSSFGLSLASRSACIFVQFRRLWPPLVAIYSCQRIHNDAYDTYGSREAHHQGK